MALSESAKISTRTRKSGKTAKSTEQVTEAFAKAESSTEASESKSKIRSLMKDNAFFVKMGAAFTAFGGFVKEKAAAAKQGAINFGHDFSAGYAAYKEARATRIEESNLSSYRSYLEERGYSVVGPTERLSIEELKGINHGLDSNIDKKVRRNASAQLSWTNLAPESTLTNASAVTEQASAAKNENATATASTQAVTASTQAATASTQAVTAENKSMHSVSRCIEELNKGRDNGIVNYLQEIIDAAQQYIKQSQSEAGTQLQDIDTVTKALQRGGRFMYDVRKGYVDSIQVKATEETTAKEASSEGASL